MLFGHIPDAPTIALGWEGTPTFIALVAEPVHPLPSVTVYTTVTAPAETPVATPVLDTIVAEPVPLMIDHTPPGVALVNAVGFEPIQILVGPPPIAGTDTGTQNFLNAIKMLVCLI